MGSKEKVEVEIIATDNASGKLSGLFGTLGNITGTIGKGMAVIGGAALSAGVAVAGFIGSTIAPASDLNETISKIGVVFGEQSKRILEFGQTSATALGMSQNSALGAVGTYGNLFRAMGITEEKSADMSMSLVSLAGDLASFNNMDPTMVLDSLRAGLSGETEPLKKLGVNLNQALIQAKALELGLWDGTGALDASAKAQATYALVLEQTTLAQGDFERTSGGLANQQRIFQATLENLKAEIGTGFLPLIQTVMAMLIEQMPTIRAMIEPLVPLITNALTGIIPLLSELITGLLPIIMELLSALIPVFASMIPVLIQLAQALLPALISILNALIPLFQGLMPVILVVVEVIVILIQALMPIIEAILPILISILEFLVNIIQTYIVPALRIFAEWLGKKIPIAMEALRLFWENKVKPILEKMKEFFDKVAEAIRGIIDAVKNVIDWFGKMIDKIKDIKLPDWLTPGSPTPFELGLLGIAGAFDKVTNNMPTFSAPEFGVSGSPGMGFRGGSGGGGQNITIVYSPALSLSDETEVRTRLTPLILDSMKRAGLA